MSGTGDDVGGIGGVVEEEEEDEDEEKEDSGGQSHKWPRSGRIGYIDPAVWGVPDTS